MKSTYYVYIFKEGTKGIEEEKKQQKQTQQIH